MDWMLNGEKEELTYEQLGDVSGGMGIDQAMLDKLQAISNRENCNQEALEKIKYKMEQYQSAVECTTEIVKDLAQTLKNITGNSK